MIDPDLSELCIEFALFGALTLAHPKGQPSPEALAQKEKCMKLFVIIDDKLFRLQKLEK